MAKDGDTEKWSTAIRLCHLQPGLESVSPDSVLKAQHPILFDLPKSLPLFILVFYNSEKSVLDKKKKKKNYISLIH